MDKVLQERAQLTLNGNGKVWVGASSRNLPLHGMISKKKEAPYTFVSDLY